MEYKLPDNYIMKPETAVRLNAIAEACNLTGEQVQEFIDLHVEAINEYNEAMCSTMIQTAQANMSKKIKYDKHHHSDVDMSQLSKRSSKGKGYIKPLRKQ